MHSTYQPVPRKLAAIQFEGRNGQDCIDFARLPPGNLTFTSYNQILKLRFRNHTGTAYIQGLEQDVRKTQWLVRENGGDVYVLSDERFCSSFVEVLPDTVTQAGEFKTPDFSETDIPEDDPVVPKKRARRRAQ